MAIVRCDAPAVLITHAARWTQRFMDRRNANPQHPFRWPEAEGRPLNEHLLPPLLAMTAYHCAYCDHFQLGEGSRETIDHFRPKGRAEFSALAFAWDNLFPACDRCQSNKGEDFDEALLRPDGPGYRFDRYFIYNHRTGDIEASPAASLEDQRRAEVTIRLFGLNRSPRPEARRRRIQGANTPGKERVDEGLDVLPYRFLPRRSQAPSANG